MTTPTPGFTRRLLAFCSVLLLALCVGAIAAEPGKVAFDIPAGAAEPSLKMFAAQSGLEVLFSTETAARVTTNAVKGEFSPAEAIGKLLEGTALTATQDARSGAMRVARANGPNGNRVAPNETSDRPATNVKIEEGVVKMGVFEVMESKLLNMDIARSRDDAQPYVIFDRMQIERSGATNLEDFLKQRLTMNTQAATPGQSQQVVNGVTTGVNLRGLGRGQTLILVDGRRTPTINQLGGQFNLNGIPLSAIERVEILPTTASGIYGGSATGGVINIILRRDYAGAELKLTYDNSLKTDTAAKRADLSLGFVLEGGKTNILLAANYSERGSLVTGDRDLYSNGRAMINASNPGFFPSASNPPLGSTPNIRSTTGAPLTLKSTGQSLGSHFTHVPTGYRGAAFDGVAGLVANAGRYNFALANSAQGDGGAKSSMLTAVRSLSFNGTVRRQFSPTIQAFAEIARSKSEGETPYSGLSGVSSTFVTVPVTATTNPFNQAIRVSVPNDSADGMNYSFTKEERAVAGVIVKLPWQWQLGLDYVWSRTVTGFTQPPVFLSSRPDLADINSGALDVLRDPAASRIDFSPYLRPGPTIEPFRTDLKDATIRVSGPLGRLPGGAPVLSAFIERRKESAYDAADETSYYPLRSQEIDSAYVELKVPVISAENKIRFIQELSLQAAGRSDRYTTNGATTVVPLNGSVPIVRGTNVTKSDDPTVGLRWVVASDLLLRTSWGTGFLPPSVGDLASAPSLVPANILIDPRRGNTLTGPVSLLNGGRPDLKPELSESWSAGMVLTPRLLRGFRLALDYTRIEKRDVFAALGPQALINAEMLLPGRVTRGPVPAGDPFGVGPIIAMDRTTANLSAATLEALDIALDYSVSTESLGGFEFYLLATRNFHFLTQFIANSPIVETVGLRTVASIPLKWKCNFGVTWSFGRWKAGWSGQYFDSHYVADPTAPANAATIANQGGLIIDSQTYHDIFVNYRFRNKRAGDRGIVSLMAASEIQLGVNNLLDQSPPFDAAAATGGYYSGLGNPRLATYYISVKRNF